MLRHAVLALAALAALAAPAQAFAPGAFGCCNKVSMGDVYWRREQWAKESLADRPPGMLIHRVQE